MKPTTFFRLHGRPLLVTSLGILLGACATPPMGGGVLPTPPSRKTDGLDLTVEGKRISLSQLQKQLFPTGTLVTIHCDEGYEQDEALKMARDLYQLGYKVEMQSNP